jgi:hypothetical protein
MPKPKNVNPRNFQVESIIFDNGEFSIGWGRWEDGTMRLGMRWNGDNNDPGYPKLFKNPVWFVLPHELSLPIVSSLLGDAHSSKQDIITVLNKLL